MAIVMISTIPIPIRSFRVRFLSILDSDSLRGGVKRGHMLISQIIGTFYLDSMVIYSFTGPFQLTVLHGCNTTSAWLLRKPKLVKFGTDDSIGIVIFEVGTSSQCPILHLSITFFHVCKCAYFISNLICS